MKQISQKRKKENYQKRYQKKKIYNRGRRKLKIATKNGLQRGKKDDYNHERKEENKSKQTQT